ncbi:hypothetical protein MRB53_010297 [Persea americana]|uniref:Uncharacterized protein n=1 Tax=Persea americana TaxID=3435 RepID=A0ACC2LRE3_PERAE|nr:hypothetical protein MRB53_010297 [Persea americana]|eukprot:TRINITY_DN15961_c0_g1_i5.p1 TRINITY_DN15961_c0_g1~~TRINITY_DN15961_c0_g1_i5.p1  ORF type:complete len:194 (-),score=40.71 TRINITY_DN15961_c0_g1_i5:519-1100(-)
MVAFLARTGRESQRYSITGQRLVVGCIPYRLKEEKQEDDGDKPCSSSCMEEMMEVLLISSQKGGDEIMFPKGGWEKDESIEDAARREAWEEAGVMGNVQLKEFLGKWSFKSKRYGTMYDGFMFPLHVTEELDPWPEMNVRRRRWVTVAEARESCKHFWMKEALEKLVEHLSSTNEGELSMKESLEKSNSADKP